MLLDGIAAGETYTEIAEKLGRSRQGVSQRAYQLRKSAGPAAPVRLCNATPEQLAEQLRSHGWTVVPPAPGREAAMVRRYLERRTRPTPAEVTHAG